MRVLSDKKQISVLQIVRDPVGGIRKHILSIINHLDSGEFNNYFVANISTADSKYHKDLNNNNLSKNKIFDFPIKSNPSVNDISIIFKIYKIFKNKKIDIIHGHGAKGGLYARILGVLLGAKVIYTAHGGSLHTMFKWPLNFLYSSIEKIMYYFTDLLLFESKYSQNQYFTRIKKCPHKSILNYNGVAIRHLAPMAKLSKEKQTVIGAFGLLRKIKGHDILIRALSILKEDNYNIKLNIYGDGEELTNLQNLIEDLKLRDEVSIYKKTDEPELEMVKCSIIVHPSRFESFGYVAVEAMANGRPIIASYVGGLKEIIIEKENGLFFNLNDTKSLANSIKLIIDNQILRDHLITSGHKTVNEKFNEIKMVENIVKQYRKLADSEKL